MAPNIPIQESEESSVELVVDINSPNSDPVPELPKQFQSHLEQHFHAQDSPNLHQLRIIHVNGDPRTHQSQTTILRPRVIQHVDTSTPSSATSTWGVPAFEIRDRNVRRRPLGAPQQPDGFQKGTLLPPTVPPRIGDPSGVSTTTSRGRELFGNPTEAPQVTRTRNPGRRPESGILLSTNERPSLVNNEDDVKVGGNTKPPPPPPPPTTTASTTTISTTKNYLDSGVLRIPGHEPEAPADLNLIHQERAIDTTNQTGQGGIFVKDDSNGLTNEGATALILVGLCSVFLVFICFAMFVQKIKRQKIESKVVQDDSGIKHAARYESTGTTMYQPNPLSFLPPDILNALLHPLAASRVHGAFEEPKPAFVTMEPPQPGNLNQLGRLWFSVYYDYVKSTLVLHILHARYVKGRGSTTNPGTVWVEACVLTPMNTIKASSKTDTRRASLAPVFNQNFKFEVEDEEVTQYLLRLTLYDKHPQHEEKAVGSVIVPLSTVDLCSTETISRDLQ
ncbi:uncharacterized protein [Macrobrachium rosenbergii]|uniref:uncharacterized protein n=1 Tax=Macrobrachium rosenbergii TaxID=79674 RepID=UPI0034D3ECB9